MARRADIDVIRIVLTWAILLYHTVQIYLKEFPFFVDISSSSKWTLGGVGFIISM